MNGVALPVAVVRHGYVPSRATSGHVTKGSLWHGGSLRAASVGEGSWNQLCSPLGMPADDDDVGSLGEHRVFGRTPSLPQSGFLVFFSSFLFLVS